MDVHTWTRVEDEACHNKTAATMYAVRNQTAAAVDGLGYTPNFATNGPLEVITPEYDRYELLSRGPDTRGKVTGPAE